MDYKVVNLITEEYLLFNTYEEAYNYVLYRVDELNRIYKDNCWTNKDFQIFEFCAEQWNWIQKPIKSV